jgi:hypothetical protein
MTRKHYVADGYVDLKKEVVRDKKGRRIDSAYVARVVKAADAVRPVGRPGLNAHAGPSSQIAVRLPASTYEQIKLMAKERGVTAAALARQAVEEFLRKAV